MPCCGRDSISSATALRLSRAHESARELDNITAWWVTLTFAQKFKVANVERLVADTQKVLLCSLHPAQCRLCWLTKSRVQGIAIFASSNMLVTQCDPNATDEQRQEEQPPSESHEDHHGHRQRREKQPPQDRAQQNLGRGHSAVKSVRVMV